MIGVERLASNRDQNAPAKLSTKASGKRQLAGFLHFAHAPRGR
jgi:hypothetical protein